MIEYGQYLIPSNLLILVLQAPVLQQPHSMVTSTMVWSSPPTGMTSIISVKMSSNMPQTPVVSRRRPVFERAAWAILLQTKRVHQQQMEMLLDVVWYHWVNLFLRENVSSNWFIDYLNQWTPVYQTTHPVVYSSSQGTRLEFVALRHHAVPMNAITLPGCCFFYSDINIYLHIWHMYIYVHIIMFKTLNIIQYIRT